MVATRRPATWRKVLPALPATAVLILAGCGQGGAPNPGTPPPPPPAATSATSTCANLVDSGQALVNTVVQFIGGNASLAQVRSAVTQLSDQITSVRASAGPEAAPNLNDASTSLQDLQEALNAQPPDLTAARTSATDTQEALRNAAASCQSKPATPAPTT